MFVANRLLRGRGCSRARASAALALAQMVLACWAHGCGNRAGGAAAARKVGEGESRSATVSSNVLRQDYAGSAACEPCHAEVVSAWRRSPMHRMTRLPEQTEVRAPFDGRTFHFKGDAARLEQVNGIRFMRLTSRERGTQIYRVTKVIGGRYREDFAGVEVASTDPGARAVAEGGRELLLPVSYVFQNQSLRVKGYSVMVGERPGLRAGGVWNQTCIFCHNTVPYFDDLWGALDGPGAPGYQGEVVDRMLPAARRLRYESSSPLALLRALDQERSFLRGAVPGETSPQVTGGDAAGAIEAPPAPSTADDVRSSLRAAMQEARTHFGPSQFVEIGIGCESCHGGSRQHVDDPRLHPTFEPRAPFLTVTRAQGGDAVSAAEWQNRACARCHQVLFSRYSHTWEGGSRRSAGEAGGSHITSGEARDFLLGGCARAMTCATCHDPHGEDKPESLARLATTAGNGVCTGCHQSLATAVAVKAHAHHDPAGAGGACVACHMPRKNMGLGYGLTRYHRIGSPTDSVRVQGDRPLECALCHANKTVGGLLADMQRLWGKRYDSAAVARLYGSLEANALVATIERGYAHEQAAAIDAAGEQHFKPAVAAIAHEITGNVYPLVRYHAAAALAAIEGRPVPAALGADGAVTHGEGEAPAQPAGAPARAGATAGTGKAASDRQEDED